MNESKIPRRTFLKGIAATSLIASNMIPLQASDDILPLEETKELSGNEFYLTVEYRTVNFSGSPAIATTVNGMVPSPTLRWKEGEWVTIHVTNKLRVPTIIHWHGIVLPANMDGVPGVNAKEIEPNETFTYKFQVKQHGTYWYHSHYGYQEQSGMHGAIIIEPKKADPYKYDKDYVIFLGDWSDEKPENIFRKLKVSGEYYNFKERTVGDFVDEVKDKGFLKAFNDRKMWNSMSMSDRDLSDVTGYTYTYLMNGKNPNEGFRALCKSGEKVRLRFINGSAMTFFDVRIPDLTMKVIATDGNLIKPVDVDEFRIGVAECYDVIVAPKQNAYAIFAQALDRSGYAIGYLSNSLDRVAKTPPMDPLPILDHIDMGMGGMHNMDGMDHGGDMDMSSMDHGTNMDMGNMKHDSSMDMSGMQHGKDMSMSEDCCMSKQGTKDIDNIPKVDLPSATGPQIEMVSMNPQYRLDDPGVGLRDNGRKVLTYADLRSLHSTKDDKFPEREFVIHLTGNMQRYVWGINGIAYKDSEPWKLKYGERIRITCINDTMMNHPMHLHGMWSDLETGDDNFLPRKHTIVVQPGAKISFRVTVDAEGSWVFHCHMLYHMMEMFRRVDVVEELT